MAYGIQTLDVLDMIVHDQLELVWYTSRGGAPSSRSRNQRHSDYFAVANRWETVADIIEETNSMKQAAVYGRRFN